MPKLQDHIVSIWKGEVNKGIPKGSGFCIAPKIILTAWHVVKDIAEDEMHLGFILSAEKGGRVNKISRIGNYDAAIIELLQPHEKPMIKCGYIDAIRNIPAVELVAYQESEGTIINPLKKQIANINKDHKHWHFDNYPAEGMSGGAVIYQGKVIGIIRAQSKNNNDGVFLPLHFLKKEIKAILLDNIVVTGEAEIIKVHQEKPFNPVTVDISNKSLEAIREHQSNTCRIFGVNKYISDAFDNDKNAPELSLIPNGFIKLDEKKLAIDKPFYLSRNPVTVEDYNYYLDDIGSGYEKKSFTNMKHPIINISWLEAMNYIDWLSKKTEKNYRLPTETQWEYAARQGHVRDGLVYQRMTSIGIFNCYELKKDKALCTTMFSKDYWGLYSMYGNVWEWVDSSFRDKKNVMIIKGGSFSEKNICYSSHNNLVINDQDDDIGFRVIREI